MSHQFRELLKKIGSGQQTSKNLTRTEVAIATKMILTQEATPAQIGAFMIAHRIKRPTAQELAGMLDTYDQLGSRLAYCANFRHPVTVLGIPYDGRSRTAPINPLIALMLASIDIPIILHGGDHVPTKYGLPLIEIFQGLGMDFSHLSLGKIQQIFEQTNLGFLYTRTQFLYAQNLIPYRDEIGKRPPFSTIELIWQPYLGESKLISGYAHHATEKILIETFKERKLNHFTLIKGLEGSPDLSLSKTNIIVVNQAANNQEIKYLKLKAKDYDLQGEDLSLESPKIYLEQAENLITRQNSPLTKAVIWNGGFYLFNLGICDTIENGLTLAENLINQGKLQDKRAEIQQLIITK